jgi:protein arginine N-methyltransferase 7
MAAGAKIGKENLELLLHGDVHVFKNAKAEEDIVVGREGSLEEVDPLVCLNDGDETRETYDDDDEFANGPDEERDLEKEKQRLRGQLIYMVQEAFERDPRYLKKPLSVLQKEAAQMQKKGDEMSAIGCYAKLFSKVKKNRLTHPELYVTHCNRSSAYLNLGLYEEALWDAMKAMQLAERAIEKNPSGAGSGFRTYVRAHAKKGFSLLGLQRLREAADTFDKGLKCDPFNEDLKLGLEEAQRLILEDLLSGSNKGLRVRALPRAEASQKQRITMQPYSTPLHKIRTDDMLPHQLLTPFQAENDYHIKDAYNYVTVQADIRMPKYHFSYLEDDYRNGLYRSAIEKAVRDISVDKDCRVLNVGAGSGLNTMMCLEAGAYHVTATERWLYLAMSSKEVLLDNGYNDDQVKVVYKRATDLALIKDVPVACNLLLCDVLDDGLLTSGMIPAVKHCLDNIMIDKPVVIPCSATVYVQAGQVYTEDVCGFDMSKMNRHRWMPSFTSGLPFREESFVPLAAPVEVWQFNMLTPPEEASQHSIDVQFSRPGVFNAVRFWYDLHLYGDVHISTGPEAVEAGLKSLRPAVQFLKGQMLVNEEDVIPLVAMHNTVRIRFDIQDAEYVCLSRPDASFPQNQFSFLNDVGRNEAYYGAIGRVVAKMKKEGREVHALDMGCGSGLLSMMAARCGADSVVAAELHDSVCETARHVVAQNGLSSKVSVVNRDVGLLERGKHVRTKGANLVIADFFDAGLLHDNFLFLLEKAKTNVLQSDYSVVPAAATVYCMGIEAYTKHAQGFDFSLFNKYRWDKTYDSVDLSTLPHRKLTKPKKVFEYFFQGDRKGRSRENVLKLEVVNPGHLNAIVFWFDLHLDEEETITSAPFSIGIGGKVAHNYCESKQDDGDVEGDDGFMQSDSFAGQKRGYVFKRGPQGLGYYVDIPRHVAFDGQSSLVVQADAQADEEADSEKHHWGQALQYLDRAVLVEPANKKKKRITILAKREGNTIRFSLKEGVGCKVSKSPWKVEWGGGASVENPHRQRVHYCELLVKDFLMRLRSKRFPPIEKDMKMLLANCGNLFLDPTVITEVYHEFVCLEMIHSNTEFCPGASLEALTKPPFRYS